MHHRRTLLILEDDDRRTEAMHQELLERLPQYHPVFCTDATRFISTLTKSAGHVLGISLDHDLEPKSDDGRDPGTGRDVADFLVDPPFPLPRLPILIHSTNRIAADGMERVLTEAGYPLARVTPYGDLDWIAELWFPSFEQQLARFVDVQ